MTRPRQIPPIVSLVKISLATLLTACASAQSPAQQPTMAGVRARPFSGSGSLGQGATQRGSEFSSVLEWPGVTCDGLTDDTAGLQAAIDHLSKNGGRLLFPPARRCRASGLVARWSKHAFILSGTGGDLDDGGSQLEYIGPSGGTLLTLAAKDEVVSITVTDLALKNASNRSATAIAVDNICPGVVRLERDWIMGFNKGEEDTGIRIAGNWPPTDGSQVTNSVHIDGCQFWHNSVGILSTLPTVRELWITDSVFIDSSQHSVWQKFARSAGADSGAMDWFIERNTFYGDHIGSEIQLEGIVNHVAIERNYFEYNNARHLGPKTEITVATGNLSNGITISDNTFNDSLPSKHTGVVHITTKNRTAAMTGISVERNVFNGNGDDAPFLAFGNSGAGISHYRVERPSYGAGVRPLALTTSNPGCAATLCSDHVASYETGSWVPTIVGSSKPGTQTYKAQEGWWSRIGNTVTLTVHIELASNTGGAGRAAIGGTLPVELTSSNPRAGGGSVFNVSGVAHQPKMTAFGVIVTGSPPPILSLTENGSNQAGSYVPIGNVSSTAIIDFVVSYRLAAR